MTENGKNKTTVTNKTTSAKTGTSGKTTVSGKTPVSGKTTASTKTTTSAKTTASGKTTGGSVRKKYGKKKKPGFFHRLLVCAVTVIVIFVGVITLVRVTSGMISLIRRFVSGRTEYTMSDEGEGGIAVEGAYANTIPHDDAFWQGSPEIQAAMLTPNSYSRPQIALRQIDGIVIHYTADPGASASAIRNYFENLKNTGERHASSHFVIGLDGEIVQCIPCAEQAYCSNNRNGDTLSIECCHPDESGVFTDATYRSAVELTAWLCKAFRVDPDGVIRHFDVTGKDCPRWFVQDGEAWDTFREDVRRQYEKISEQ